MASLLLVAAVVRQGDKRLLINAALFGVSALFFRRDSRIELDKFARRCRIQRLDMLRRSDRTIAFDDIRDVGVEVMRPDTSVQAHTRLSILTAADRFPLTAGYTADLSTHIAIREVMVDAIFSGTSRPPPLDPAQVLRDGGRPFTAALRE
jgi:hypothetical protein